MGNMLRDAMLTALAREDLLGLPEAPEPLSAGDTVRVEFPTRAGTWKPEAKFLGVNPGGTKIVLLVEGGRLHVPRCPEPGSTSGICFEDRQRIETWLAGRRAAGRTTLPKLRGSRRAGKARTS